MKIFVLIIFLKPISDREKNIVSVCNSFDINFSKDELLNYLYSLSFAVKHRDNPSTELWFYS
ncbi:hypothetical protein QTP88_010832 [Uroleucon formosanum]